MIHSILIVKENSMKNVLLLAVIVAALVGCSKPVVVETEVVSSDVTVTESVQ